MWGQPGDRLAVAPMLNEHEPLIVNAIGHLAGAIVFAMFLVLALKGSTKGRTGQSWLSVVSAGLALLWNAGSLAAILLPPGSARWFVEAVSFCSLSLLPAVLLHLSLNKRFRLVALIGYALSVAATGMHLCEDLQPAFHLHKAALWVITVGFGMLTMVYAAAVLRTEREARGRASQILASMCLLLFAVTFSHFGSGHPPQPWKELFVHHAGIPIALLILLQDYRFVFLDVFIRFLANVSLAALLSYFGLGLWLKMSPLVRSSGSLADLIVAAGLCGLLILFAYLRGVLQRLLTRAIFRSGRIETIIVELRSRGAKTRDENDYLAWAAGRLAAATDTAQVELLGCGAENDLDYPAVADEHPWLARYPERSWVEAVVPIRLTKGDVRYVLLGRRRGGRRYLSEDFLSLNRLASVVAEEVERRRTTEMQRLVSEAELRALHSQINPHFLFNALNTIYGIIPREAGGARRTVLNLADIFRYFLQSDRVLIPLSEEMKIVKAYLDIERLRLGPRLHTTIQIDKEAEHTLIPVLSVQPLVENAIKHALSVRPDDGWLRVQASVSDGTLNIVVEDSGAGPAKGSGTPSGAGVGIANVSRRLQLCFGHGSEVKMVSEPSGTRVQFSVPLAPASSSTVSAIHSAGI